MVMINSSLWFCMFFFFTKVMDLIVILKTIEESPLQKPLAKI